MDWRDHGACRGADDPELFFPVGPGGSALRQAAAAVKVCRPCPVREQCLAWALDSGVDDGVFGGLTAVERRALRRYPGDAEDVADEPDWVVVDRLVKSGRELGATRHEVALAAIRMVLAGRALTSVAAHLGVHQRSVQEWVRRAESGLVLVQAGTARGARRRAVA